MLKLLETLKDSAESTFDSSNCTLPSVVTSAAPNVTF